MEMMKEFKELQEVFNRECERAHKYFRYGIYSYEEMLMAMREAELRLHREQRALILNEMTD